METQHVVQSDLFWQRIQAVTGLIFALFVFVHLANTTLAVVGSSAYNNFQAVVRAAYQAPVVEILLLGVILPSHILAGFRRARIRRANGGMNLSVAQRWHRWAGWFLVFVIYVHVAAVRLPSLLYDVWPRFAGVAFAIEWVPAYFYPYYFLLALAGFYHATNGSLLALGRVGVKIRPLRLPAARWVLIGGGATIIVSLLGFGGVWFDVGDPMNSEYARLYLELMGPSAE
jgi:succinate dehydrogenase/fumarate reductase cytochrome b subunit